MNSVRVRTEDYRYQQEARYTNPIKNEGSVIEGYFYKENLVKEMAIRKVNKLLCSVLMVAIAGAFVSYYYAMTSELSLNVLSRKITALNDENAELQHKLDRLKSFNNVDDKMTQFNVLQKPEKVIEVQAVAATVDTKESKLATKNSDTKFFWSVGY